VPGIRNDHLLMQVIDGLNQRKRHDVFLAAQGIGQPWAMRRDMLSPAYTTRWEDLPSCR
jgi:error-prone repair protein umuC